MEFNFINIIDYLGTFAFAISGVRLASAKRFDWFGAYVVGLVTAIGGGTTRDLLLNVTPFWMTQPSYLIITGLALVFVVFLKKYVVRMNNTVFIFDAIGLGLFTVVGINKTLEAGFPFWAAIVMGTITGSVGGVIRDILINEVPLIFRKDIYALASIVGGVCYMFYLKAGLPVAMTETLVVITVILIRVVAVKFHWSLPVLKSFEDYQQNKKGKDASN